MKRLAFSLLLLASASTGCYRTHMHVSRAAAQNIAHLDWDGRWYHDIVYGLAEISGPVRLDRLCPGGAAEVQQQTSFLNGLVQWLTGSLYNPQEVTVYCASGASARVFVDEQGDAVGYVGSDGRPSALPPVAFGS